MIRPLRFNPFAMVTHNGERWPRIVHHLMHGLLGASIGLGVWLVSPWVRWPPVWYFVALAAVFAVLDKCVWIDTVGRRLVWTGYQPDDVPDFVADLGFTVLGATVWAWLPVWWAVLPCYYALSLFSDP